MNNNNNNNNNNNALVLGHGVFKNIAPWITPIICVTWHNFMCTLHQLYV